MSLPRELAQLQQIAATYAVQTELRVRREIMSATGRKQIVQQNRQVVPLQNGEKVVVTFETPYSGDRAGCDMADFARDVTNSDRVQFGAFRDYQSASGNCEHARYVMREAVMPCEGTVQREGTREYVVAQNGMRIRTK